MNDFELKAYKIEELNFVNKTVGLKKLELTHKYAYNVGYSKMNTCRGEFKAEIFDKEAQDTFSLSIVVSCVFATAAGTPKEVLHIKTYNAIFPYVKALVSTFTASTGIMPVNIPYIDISDKNIYRVEMPENDG